MFKLSTVWRDASVHALTPLLDCMVHDALVLALQLLRNPPLQLLHSPDLVSLDALPNYASSRQGSDPDCSTTRATDVWSPAPRLCHPVRRLSKAALTSRIIFRELHHKITPCLTKTVQSCFCQNFVKFSTILTIFGRKMAKRLNLCKMYLFSTSHNLRHQ